MLPLIAATSTTKPQHSFKANEDDSDKSKLDVEITNIIANKEPFKTNEISNYNRKLDANTTNIITNTEPNNYILDQNVEVERDIMEIFDLQVTTYPNNIATSYKGQSITYQQLDLASNRVANYLKANFEIGPNMPVAVIGSNKLDLITFELAILKAGAAFVPFDPDVPKERLDYTLENAGMKLIIACDERSHTLLSHQNCPILDLEARKNEIDRMSSEKVPPHKDSKKSDLAYILYTSGSTSNTPKGVMQTRMGLPGQIEIYTETLNITSNDQFLQLAPFPHDQAVIDTFGALLNGAGLHLVDMNLESLDFLALQKMVRENTISIFSSIPSVFTHIFGDVDNNTSFPSLRIVTLGGEAVKLDHVRLYQKIAPPGSLFINGYGATECSWIGGHHITTAESLENHTTVPLGQMARDIEVFLDYTQSDEAGVGELCIHSKNMSPGYWNNNEATVAAFFEHNGKKFYRTGDLVFCDSQNVYQFKGRVHWHDKINGKRVNLNEVENCLQRSFPFEECVVMSHGNENKKLYAFYTLNKNVEFEANENLMRRYLFSVLKPHEMPFKFFGLEKIPKLSNAKVDRKALSKNIEKGILDRQAKREQILERLNFVDRILYEILDLNLEKPFNEEINPMECGLDSFGMLSLQNKINAHLQTKRPAIHIELNELINSTTNYGIRALIRNKRADAKIDHPFYKPEYTLERVFPPEDSYYDQKDKTITFNFASMAILAKFYNEKYKICIKPCNSQTLFFDEVHSFVESGQVGQIGLTWPQNSRRDGHPTPCILLRNVKGEVKLCAADSVWENTDFKEKINDNGYLHKDVSLYIDPYSRQEDFVSCSIDSLMYLKNALRLDFDAHIKLISRSQLDCYRTRFFVNGFPPETTFFQSPAETLKHSQSLQFPKELAIEVSASAILNSKKKNETLGQYRQRIVKTERFYSVFEKSSMCEFPHATALMKKGQKFQDILEKFHVQKSEPN